MLSNCIILIIWSGPVRDNLLLSILQKELRMHQTIFSVQEHPGNCMRKEMKLNRKYRGSKLKFKRGFYCLLLTNFIVFPILSSVLTTLSKTKI